jgi:16S rRNA (uracil1498-N3)-methyltransferase
MMHLPFFYISDYDGTKKEIVLNEETSRHVVQVLRMKVGEQLNLTDGKGTLLTCEITEANKKHCAVSVTGSHLTPHTSQRITIAISLLKNTNRFEWFLEKATEIGISEIIPLHCERTEKEKFRYDRLNGICISAMLQSQQTWLPVLQEPTNFGNLIIKQFDDCSKYIAHCMNEESKMQLDRKISKSLNQLICIGPEGDFTKQEIELALKNNFTPVNLGSTRLRTETAGVVAATLLCITNH